MGTSLITEKQKKAFYSKIKINEETECWEWQASKNESGYGWFRTKFGKKAHRFSYLLYYGKINSSLTIDHLCRNRSCVNPEHLELVPIGVNTLRGNTPWAINARKTHCKRGHELSGNNLYTTPDGRRNCKICKYITNQKGLLGTKGTFL